MKLFRTTIGVLVLAGASLPVFAARPPTLHDLIGLTPSSQTTAEIQTLKKPQTQHFHPRRLLVRFKQGATLAGRQAAHRAAQADTVLWDCRVVDGLQLVEVPEARLLTALAVYQKHPDVLYAERDPMVRAIALPNDPHFDLLWGLHNTGQAVNSDPGTEGADIQAVGAWDLCTGDPDFRIAVIDTGVDYTHPDLVENMWTNPDEVVGDANNDGCPGLCDVDDDGDGLVDEDSQGHEPGHPDYLNDLVDDDDENGWADDIHGYDFHNDDGDPMDDYGHGTHVAGTIGAVGDNAVGVVGVNWECSIVALKFIGSDGWGYISDAVRAMEYVIDSGIKISNNSWSCGCFVPPEECYSQALYDIIAQAQSIGHIFVASAGNCYIRNIDDHPIYPASFDLPNIITVAATDNDDVLSYFSNVGPTAVDLGAPGSNVYSTVPFFVSETYYDYSSGTSMASPHVAGVVGLVMSCFPDLTPADVLDRILTRVRPVASLEPRTVTGGIVSAAAAIGDCNLNGVPDEDEIQNCPPGEPSCDDCNENTFLDECEPDCQPNDVPDECDISEGTSEDCQPNGVPDECDIAEGTSEDCQPNGVPDECDIAGGTSQDANGSDVPDECETCQEDLDCDDANECTDDLCIGNLCYRSDNQYPCDDGDPCTEDDVCLEGSCIGTPSAAPECAVIFSMKAVEVNGSPLPAPVGQVCVAPADQITIDILVENWAPRRLKGYQVINDPLSYTSGPMGSLVPLDTEPCGAGPPLEPCQGAFIAKEREDYMFFQRPTLTMVGNNPTDGNYMMIGVVPDDEDCVLDLDTPAYVGTLILGVSDDAGGIFTLCLDEDPLASILANCYTQTDVEPLAFECLSIIVVSDCNDNGVPDDEDISMGTSEDCNNNCIPDECLHFERDCNVNLAPDECDITEGSSIDENGNDVPDECEPPVLFVDAAATGLNTGISWEDAFSDLQSALSVAERSLGSVEEIWIAAGTYTPSRQTDLDPRSATFQLVSGVGVYGGFAGDEVSRDERDPASNVTILSGDLNDDDGPDWTNMEDNSYHVLSATGVYTTDSLDGFTITAGNANGALSYGGGIFFDIQGSAALINLIIVGNSAYNNGAGMYVHEGESTLIDCTVAGNQADSNGGGIFVDGSSLTMTDCAVSGNLASSNGGGIHIRAGSAILTGCTLSENSAFVGGAILVGVAASATLTDCHFTGNSATLGGGGIRNYSHGDLSLTNCAFSTNSTNGCGGGMYNSASDPGLTGCSFSANLAGEDGGAIYNRDGSGPMLIECTFSNNWADRHGGGICNRSGSNAEITNCAFRGNTVLGAGGGISNWQSNPVLSNCAFSGNSAITGGGMHSYGGEPGPSLVNCTFYGNVGENGGGLGHGSGTVALVNCILWQNGGAYQSDQIYEYEATTDVTYSCIQGCTTFCSDPDDYNIDDKPLFINADGPDGIPGTEDDNLRLRLGSRCIDAGNDEAVTADTDLDGGARIVDADEQGPPDVDMGAYEWSDCNENNFDDGHDIATGGSEDCQPNGVPDECDIAEGTSVDDNGNGMPDECETVAYLDIKPGSCPNPVNPRSRGVVPMAVLGTELFDVTQIDIESLALMRADGAGRAVAPLTGPPGPPVSVGDVATPFAGGLCDCHELAGDSIDDLLLKFSTPELVEALALRSLPSRASLVLTIAGALLDGTEFEASDCILVLGKRSPRSSCSGTPPRLSRSR